MTGLVCALLKYFYLSKSRFICILWLPLRLSALLFCSSQQCCSSEFVAVVFLDSLSFLNLEMHYLVWRSAECQCSQEERALRESRYSS